MVVNINIIANYCCTQKLLKEAETEETIGFVSSFFFFIIGNILIGGMGGAGALGLVGYACGFMTTGPVCCHTNYKIWHNKTAKEHLPQWKYQAALTPKILTISLKTKRTV